MSEALNTLFSQIKNGQNKSILVIEHKLKRSNMSGPILDILHKEGYIRGYRSPNAIGRAGVVHKKTERVALQPPQAKRQVQILLKYNKEQGAIQEITRISKPSKKCYISVKILEKKIRALYEISRERFIGGRMDISDPGRYLNR